MVKLLTYYPTSNFIWNRVERHLFAVSQSISSKLDKELQKLSNLKDMVI